MTQEKIASRSQLLGLGGKLVQHMPADLPSDIAQEWADDPEALTQFLASLRDGPFPLSQVKTREFEVTIDPNRTVESWVGGGNYNYANPNHNTPNFGQFLTVKKGTKPYKAKVVAFCLGRSANIEKAKRVRSRLGLKPIGFEHEAAVGEQHPKAQQELGWIVNADVVWEVSGGYRSVSYLYGGADNRYLRLHVADSEWSDSSWFFGLSE